MSFHVDATITVWCESVKRGCTFTAKITDGAHALFYSGTGSTAFEAISWCLDDYVRRALLGQDATPAMRADTQPGDFATAPSSRPRRITPAPIVNVGAIERDDPETEVGCFESAIPRGPAPRTFSLQPTVIAQPTTTKRRARGGR